jgi:hypothetical protein
MIVKNPDHATRAIIEAAKTKLKHGANLARGKSAFWYLMGGGVGGGALLAGAGILCGGYSYIVGNKVIAQQVTEGVKAVLDKEVITAKLADGGEVALKAPAVVSLDPNSPLVVRVVGQSATDMPRPSQAPPVPMEYVVFNEAPFAAGQVETGAVFNDGQLTRQYCQYVQPAHAPIRTFTTIGHDGRIDLPATTPAGVDLLAAASLCDWKAESAKPAPVAPVAPVQTIQIRAAKRQGAT